MFRPVAELRRLVEDTAPRSVTVDARGDLPVSFDLSLDAEGGVFGGPFFETEGRIRETPAEFESSGNAVIEQRRATERHELRLLDEPFAVEGSHVVPVGSDVAVFVRSSDTLRASVEALLGSFYPTVGNSVDARVDRHVSDRVERAGTTVVDADYLVRLDGLGSIEPTDGGLTVEDAEVDVSRGDETTALWGFEVADHDGVFSAALGDHLPETDAVREARRSTGFTQEFVWEVENARDGVTVEATYESENASLYIEELRRRGVDTPARTTLDFGYDSGDTTSLSLDFETEGGPTTGLRNRLDAWTGFVPLPLAPFLRYLS
ncbi:MAG: hypothetical protein ACLFSW_02600 [Halobacteriales archaeon]